MNTKKKWLVGILAISFAVALYSIYSVHFEKHSDNHSNIDDNWEKYWDEYYYSVELALDVLQARHDGRTHDFASLLAADLFNESLRKAIHFYENDGYQSKVDAILKVYIYRCVVDLAADPRPPGQVFDSQTIRLFRRIQNAQPILSDVLTPADVNASVADFIETSIRDYDACHAKLPQAVQITNHANHATSSP